MIIRPAIPADAAALQAIYAHHVLHGAGTFEEEPPTVADMEGRMEAVLRRGLPYLAAVVEDRVAGFAYAAPFRLRSAYRFTAEDSIYIHPEHQGQGVGKTLLETVVGVCERAGLHQLMAVIGDSENKASIGVHRACGFALTGVSPGVGFKHGRWVDVVWLLRPLNGGVDAAPQVKGLDLGAS
ncbi:MAG: family N-acetyltransferase [Caulobacteraceae bacterium]|nr:family N-acetyltransferase [Caulobacteraceae bacterium]